MERRGTQKAQLSVKPNSQRPPETRGNRWSTTTDQKVRGSNPFKRTIELLVSKSRPGGQYLLHRGIFQVPQIFDRELTLRSFAGAKDRQLNPKLIGVWNIYSKNLDIYSVKLDHLMQNSLEHLKDCQFYLNLLLKFVLKMRKSIYP